MRFEFLAVLYGIACALPAFSAPQAPPLPQSVAFVSGDVAAPATKCDCSGPEDCRGICRTTCECQNCLASSGVYEWRTYSDTESQAALYCNGVQIGAYSYRTGNYRPVNVKTREWGEPCRCPTALPELNKRLAPIAPEGNPYPLRFGAFVPARGRYQPIYEAYRAVGGPACSGGS